MSTDSARYGASVVSITPSMDAFRQSSPPCSRPSSYVSSYILARSWVAYWSNIRPNNRLQGGQTIGTLFRSLHFILPTTKPYQNSCFSGCQSVHFG